MVTYCISSQCFAALLDAAEPCDIRETVSSCLLAAGCLPWQSMEAELFSAPEGRLLIVRPQSPQRVRLGRETPRLRRG